MKIAFRISILLLCIFSLRFEMFAQPLNDDCGGAFVVPFSESEANVIRVAGDTRGATASTVPNGVCSTLFSTDDIFFQFTTPATVEYAGIVVRAYFENSSIGSDVSAVGMALYASCDPGEVATHCFSSNVPEEDRFEISGLCLLTNHTYMLRVWSTGGDTTTEGTLRIGVYPNGSIKPFLWWETFGGGLAVNGWTTYGTCFYTDSNQNAYFKYLEEALIDSGAYAAPGSRITSFSFCDGAVGVDSDFNDNAGIAGNFGTGQCPTPGTKFLVSPPLYSGGWNVAGLSLSWTQAIRQFYSEYFISYRTKDIGNDWIDWIDKEMNKEFPINSLLFDSDFQQHFLPGAAGHDSIQIRFIYNDNYYFWAIDDVKIVETECNDLRLDTNFYAIPPWVQLPSNQVTEFAAMADVFNAGACPQTNVNLNFTVTDINTTSEFYNENIMYSRVGPDSFAIRKVFPKLINLPKHSASYQGTYTLSSDVMDFDTTDNVISFAFNVGGDEFAHENGFTRSFPINGSGIFEPPLGGVFGNIFFPVADVMVDRIIWGVNNPDELAGKTVNVYLIQWSDANKNLISENSERNIVGYHEHTFSGNEGDNAILESVLENFSDPGSLIFMRAGFHYMAVVEYGMVSFGDPKLFLLGNEARDFSPQVIAMDSAYVNGITDNRLFITVLGLSPDGNLDNIDYEVRELNPNDNRIHFGEDIVPLIRIGTRVLNTKNELSQNNFISIYPNPTSDHIDVKLEFEKPYKDVLLNLVNHLGQNVFHKVIQETITTHTESISVENLTPGNYVLQVDTKDGQRSIPVVVIR